MFQKLKNQKAQREAREREYYENWQSRLQTNLNDYTEDLKHVTRESTKQLLEKEIKDAEEFLEGIRSNLENMDK